MSFMPVIKGCKRKRDSFGWNAVEAVFHESQCAGCHAHDISCKLCSIISGTWILESVFDDVMCTDIGICVQLHHAHGIP